MLRNLSVMFESAQALRMFIEELMKTLTFVTVFAYSWMKIFTEHSWRIFFILTPLSVVVLFLWTRSTVVVIVLPSPAETALCFLRRIIRSGINVVLPRARTKIALGMVIVAVVREEIFTVGPVPTGLSLCQICSHYFYFDLIRVASN